METQIKKTKKEEKINGYSFESWVSLEAEIYLNSKCIPDSYCIDTIVRYWEVSRKNAEEEFKKSLNKLLPTTPP